MLSSAELLQDSRVMSGLDTYHKLSFIQKDFIQIQSL